MIYIGPLFTDLCNRVQSGVVTLDRAYEYMFESTHTAIWSFLDPEKVTATLNGHSREDVIEFFKSELRNCANKAVNRNSDEISRIFSETRKHQNLPEAPKLPWETDSISAETKALQVFQGEHWHASRKLYVDAKHELPGPIARGEIPVFYAAKDSRSKKYREGAIITTKFGRIRKYGALLRTFEENMILAILSNAERIIGKDYESRAEAMVRNTYGVSLPPYAFKYSLRALASDLKMTWCSRTYDELIASLHKTMNVSMEFKHQAGAARVDIGVPFSIVLGYGILNGEGILIWLSPVFLSMYANSDAYRALLEFRVDMKSAAGPRILTYLMTVPEFRAGESFDIDADELSEKVGWDLTENRSSRKMTFRRICSDLEIVTLIRGGTTFRVSAKYSAKTNILTVAQVDTGVRCVTEI